MRTNNRHKTCSLSLWQHGGCGVLDCSKDNEPWLSPRTREKRRLRRSMKASVSGAPPVQWQPKKAVIIKHRGRLLLANTSQLITCSDDAKGVVSYNSGTKWIKDFTSEVIYLCDLSQITTNHWQIVCIQGISVNIKASVSTIDRHTIKEQ